KAANPQHAANANAKSEPLHRKRSVSVRGTLLRAMVMDPSDAERQSPTTSRKGRLQRRHDALLHGTFETWPDRQAQYLSGEFVTHGVPRMATAIHRELVLGHRVVDHRLDTVGAQFVANGVPVTFEDADRVLMEHVVVGHG